MPTSRPANFAALYALIRAAADHVALIDPEWGRNDRPWPLLDQITNRAQIGA